MNHDPVAEVSCLGAVLINPDMLDRLLAVGLRPDDFSDPRHRVIYAGMEALHESGHAIDIVTLANRLDNEKRLEPAGGRLYFASILDGVPAAANAEHYARIVCEGGRKRRLAGLGRRIVSQADNGRKSSEIVAGIMSELDALSVETDLTATLTARDALKQIDWDADPEAAAVPTGLRAFDSATGGLSFGEMVCIGSWPGYGKSALICQLALHEVLRPGGTPALIFSAEMPAKVVMQRMVCNLSGVPVTAMRRGGLSDDHRQRIAAAQSRIMDAPLSIRQGSIDITALTAEARRAVSIDGVRLVVVDYLQLIGSTATDRRLQLEDVVNRLLGLAVTEGVVVLTASQLRKRQAGESTRPTMHDLRESAALFEAPHVVGLLHRPNLGGFVPCRMCGGNGRRGCICDGTGGTSLDTTADLYVDKNRSGPTGKVSLAWRGDCLKFGDLEGSAE